MLGTSGIALVVSLKQKIRVQQITVTFTITKKVFIIGSETQDSNAYWSVYPPLVKRSFWKT